MCQETSVLLYFVTGQLFFLRSKMMLAVKMINRYDINITHKRPFLICNFQLFIQNVSFARLIFEFSTLQLCRKDMLPTFLKNARDFHIF